jgi:hypothetical protein
MHWHAVYVCVYGIDCGQTLTQSDMRTVTTSEWQQLYKSWRLHSRIESGGWVYTHAAAVLPACQWAWLFPRLLLQPGMRAAYLQGPASRLD